MPDLVDLILQRLPPSSLELLDSLDTEQCKTSRHYSEFLQTTLNEIEQIYFRRCTEDINAKTELFISNTRKNKALLEKYSSQFEKLQCTVNKSSQVQRIKVYAQQIENLRQKLHEVMQTSLDVGPDEIFIEINQMFSTIQELELKCKEIKDKLKCYQDFPPNLIEAQYCIADIKERVKKKEAVLESNLCGKK